MIFFHILLAIQPFIAAYQHHTNSSIQCPDVVSFCPFKPPTTTFCLHFSIKSSISIPQLCHLPVCSSYSSLLAISTQSQDHPTVSMSLTQTSDPSTINTLLLQNLFLTTTLISSPCPRPGLDLTSQVPTCPESPHKVTIFVNSHMRAVAEEDLGFCERWLGFLRCSRKDLHYL